MPRPITNLALTWSPAFLTRGFQTASPLRMIQSRNEVWKHGLGLRATQISHLEDLPAQRERMSDGIDFLEAQRVTIGDVRGRERPSLKQISKRRTRMQQNAEFRPGWIPSLIVRGKHQVREVMPNSWRGVNPATPIFAVQPQTRSDYLPIQAIGLKRAAYYIRRAERLGHGHGKTAHEETGQDGRAHQSALESRPATCLSRLQSHR